jgi:hypothetical protein
LNAGSSFSPRITLTRRPVGRSPLLRLWNSCKKITQDAEDITKSVSGGSKSVQLTESLGERTVSFRTQPPHHCRRAAVDSIRHPLATETNDLVLLTGKRVHSRCTPGLGVAIAIFAGWRANKSHPYWTKVVRRNGMIQHFGCPPREPITPPTSSGRACEFNLLLQCSYSLDLCLRPRQRERHHRFRHADVEAVPSCRNSSS